MATLPPCSMEGRLTRSPEKLRVWISGMWAGGSGTEEAPRRGARRRRKRAVAKTRREWEVETVWEAV